MKTEQKKKKKTAEPNKMYFTKVNEQAIIDYALSTDRAYKSKLYQELIQPVLNEMVDKIVYTYKFNLLDNSEDLKEDCKAWLVTILDKYDTTKGFKAFSYFSVITKNWFIHKVKKQKNKREVPIEGFKSINEERSFSYDLKSDEIRERDDFWHNLWKEIDSWYWELDKDIDKKVYFAIKTLLQDSTEIEIFNKKAILLYLREITGLNTKQIAPSLKMFRIKYKEFVTKYNNSH